MKPDETRIGWMEKGSMEVSQYHCPVCDKIFHYANDTKRPQFCPECGRKNLRA